jgi:hypothetical protein
MKPHTLLMLCITALLVPSCMTVKETSNTYVINSGSKTSVAGATVAGEFIPQGGSSTFNASAGVYGVAAGKTFGPYKFALYATGRRRVHDTLTVHSLTYRWASGVRDAIPAQYTGRAIQFRNSFTDGVTQAVYHAPGEMKLDFNAESGVTVEADVSVKTPTGTERRTVSLKFDRATVKDTNFVSAPHELLRSARQRSVPFNDFDIGANRGDWKP